MKFHASRYGAVTALCVLAIGAMSIAAEGPFKWAVVVFGAFFSGLICTSIIPFEQIGDK
jgi:hypothetical protein